MMEVVSRVSQKKIDVEGKSKQVVRVGQGKDPRRSDVRTGC